MSVKTEINPKLEGVLVLDLDLDLTGSTVEYYHGCLGVNEAERRLEDSGQDGGLTFSGRVMSSRTCSYSHQLMIHL